MNKRKTLTLTICVITVFILRMVIGSEIFTISSQKLNETDNNLSAENQENPDNASFDYPYILPEDLEAHKGENYYNYYNYENININNQMIPMEQISPDESMISYQQAANIGGELLKYFYGYTYQQKTPAFLSCVQQNENKEYCYALTDGTYATPFATGNTRMGIDAITGKVIGFAGRSSMLDDAEEDLKGIIPEEISDEVKAKLNENIKTDLELMGYGSDYKVLKYELFLSRVAQYRITIEIPGYHQRTIEYLTTDNNYFEITRFVLSQYSDNYRTEHRY